jgi:hypothetical protein
MASSVIQSLVFRKPYYTAAQAASWARTHGFRYTKLDDTTNTWRFQQAPPDHFKKILGSVKFTAGLFAVVGVLKNEYKKNYYTREV